MLNSRELIQTTKKVIFFGSSSALDKFLLSYSIETASYIVDNNIEKKGLKKHGLIIKEPSCILKENFKEIIIFVTSSFYKEIKNQLEGYGLQEGVHFYNAHVMSPDKTKIFYLKDRLFILNTRAYIKKKYSINTFFKKINSYNTRYVILRWFDKLPDLEKGEDIDILIHDEDLNKIVHLLDCYKLENDSVPMDIYSVSGLPGTNYNNMAYFTPPKLGEKILKNRRLYRNLYYIPSEKEYSMSMLYHITYHKGEKSGLPLIEGQEPATLRPEHDYYNLIANKLEYDGEINLSAIHEYLKEEKWAPPLDALRRYDIGYSLSKQDTDFNREDGELIVYFIRERAIDLGFKEFIINWLDDMGLTILITHDLSVEEKRILSQNTRGGNWGKGTYPISGGLPQCIIVTYDHLPKQIPPHRRNIHPFVTNDNFFLKDKLREIINDGLATEFQFNPVHTSDDHSEALYYIELLGLKEKILRKVRRNLIDFKTKEKVLTTLPSNGTRSKVEVIKKNNRKLVKKTFKPHKERYLKREIYAHKELSKECEFIPKLIDSGENYFIIPFYEDVIRDEEEFKTHLNKYKWHLVDIVEFFYNKGFALIDFHPQNILISRTKGLKIIDFEFLYPYQENKPKSIFESYDIAGVPSDFCGDLPIGKKNETFDDVWLDLIGDNFQALYKKYYIV